MSAEPSVVSGLFLGLLLLFVLLVLLGLGLSFGLEWAERALVARTDEHEAKSSANSRREFPPTWKDEYARFR